MERQVALPLPPPLIASEPRRGVILLVILSLLTLFMMLGGTYLVMAARARATAKAFATATNGSSPRSMRACLPPWSTRLFFRW